MAAFDLSGFWTYLDDYVDGASDNTTQSLRATITVLRDFCAFTHCWKQTLADISVVADTSEYTLTTTATETDVAPEIVILNTVLYKENGLDDDQYAPLDLKSREWLDEYDPRWKYRTAPTPRIAFYDHQYDKLRLVDTPTVASTDGLSVTVVVQPDLTAATIPEFIHNKYQKAMLFGAAAEMMRMPNQRWSNKELGDHYWAMYMDERASAQQDVDTGYLKLDDYRVIPEPAFTGGSRNNSFPGGTGIA
jgi:hypothetical protein